MTHERLLYLAHLVDRVNTEVDANASINYGYALGCYIHVTMFYTKPYVSRAFWESVGTNDPELTNGDKDLVKGEAFLRVLLRSAKNYPPMRAKS